MSPARPVLVLGGAGQVGTETRAALGAAGVPVEAPARAALDVADAAALAAFVDAVRPSAIVNAAAYTAVDRAEAEPEAAWRVNARAPAVLAEAAARHGCRLVHLSTDYVYPGTPTPPGDAHGPRPYREGDAPGPLGVYGRTKLAGDAAVLASGADAVVLRTAWVFAAHGHNFVRTMLRLADEGRTALRVVADQHGTPTSAALVASGAVAAALGHAVPPGVYHLTNSGETTWHGLAEAVFAARAARRPDLPPVAVAPIPTADYPTPARRPARSVLDNAKWDRLGLVPRPTWQEALGTVLDSLLPVHA